MHQPESWGYVQFEAEDGARVVSACTHDPWVPAWLWHHGEQPKNQHHAATAVLSSKPPPSFIPDPTWPARAWLMEVYTAQHMRWRDGKGFAKELSELAVAAPPPASGVSDLKMEATEVCGSSRVGVGSPALAASCKSLPYHRSYNTRDLRQTGLILRCSLCVISQATSQRLQRSCHCRGVGKWPACAVDDQYSGAAGVQLP